MGGEREGNGEGTETGAPFRHKPPPPPVVSKGCVESGKFNQSRQPGGGGGDCLERVC